MSERASEVTRLLAVAEPTRLRIVWLLRDGPRSVGAIAAALKQPAVNVSHHLRLLANAGVLTASARGRFVDYRLNPEVYDPGGAGRPASLTLGDIRMVLRG
jgi:DNA-binding transcriptional ArsR family regulator